MKKIAFYSYKGGVGRTKVMLGVGAKLALDGHRVGMLDFDLDASGLATVLGGQATDIEQNELLYILANKDMSKVPSSIIDITSKVTESFGVKPIGNGKLAYIPTISDPSLADKIKFTSRTGIFVGDLMKEYLRNYEILLIDLRPGYSNSSGVILEKVDSTVVVTRLDRQNLGGLRTIFPQFNERKRVTKLVVNLIADNNETASRLQQLEDFVEKSVDVKIKYDPRAAYDDDFQSWAREGSDMNQRLGELVNMLIDTEPQ